MPRFVRRKPMLERIKENLDPVDWLVYLSESFDSSDLDTKSLGTTIGLVCNFVYLLARANTGRKSKNVDDVFGDTGSAGWLGWFASFLVLILSILSITNASYTFLRRRHYRLFETPLSNAPSTPNASRVRVDSSPSTNSPLRLVQKIVYASSAASRAHPDATRDVWELAIWDPTPFSLTLFQFFSPAHIVVYWLFLPIANLDPRPSMTVFTTLLLQVLITGQTYFLIHNFIQQAKDTAVRNKEVMHEYDTKYVHPNINAPVRDVGTQFSTSVAPTSTGTGPDGEQMDIDSSTLFLDEEDVTTYTPTTILRRGWKINPNPNYAKHISPDDVDAVPHRNVMIPNPVNPVFSTPVQTERYRAPPTSQSIMLDSRQHTPLRTVASHAMRQPQFRKSVGPATSSGGSTPARGDGGSLGVYTHSRSPLKKASSIYDMEKNRGTPRTGREAAQREIADDRERARRRETVAASGSGSGNGRVEKGWGGVEIRRRGGGGGDEDEKDRRRTFV